MIFNNVEKEYLKVSNTFTLPARSEAGFSTHPLKRAGSRITQTRLKELPIPVPVIVEPNGLSLDDIKVDVNGWLSQEADKVLKFNFYPKYHYMARLEKIHWIDETEHLMKGTIHFVCTEVPYRLGFKESLEINSSLQRYIIGGQVETPWQSKTTFTERTDQFVLESNKGKLIINYGFIVGDLLEIDYKSRDIKLNGVLIDVGLSLESVWFDLDVGEMKFKASHETELVYTERYY